MWGEDLEQLKTGVGGLSRLIRAYSEHQTALTKTQPARDLLDQVLNNSSFWSGTTKLTRSLSDQ